MDKNLLVAKLNKAVPGAVLEARRFGRSSHSSIWVEAQTIQKVANALKTDAVLGLDWLENLSVVEFEKVFVISYFVRSSESQFNVIIRASAVPSAPHAEVFFPSIRTVWPMGEPMEEEAEELFGILFRVEGVNSRESRMAKLPGEWKGYPLRKNYVFPEDFFGIHHSRSLNRPVQKSVDP